MTMNAARAAFLLARISKQQLDLLEEEALDFAISLLQGQELRQAKPHEWSPLYVHPARSLSEQDELLLTQGESMLEAYADDQRRRGQCSMAEGAQCSAGAIKRLIAKGRT